MLKKILDFFDVNIQVSDKTWNRFKHYFNMLKKILNFFDVNIQEIDLNVILQSSYFVQPENILLTMLGDDDEDI